MFIQKDETENESVKQLRMRIENHLYSSKELEPNFTLTKINDVLNNFKTKKAPGIDMISGEVLKIAIKCNPFIILNFVNACFNFGYFSKVLKISVIVPIPKRANLINVEIQRPISLLPTLGKFLERLIQNRLLIYPFKNNFSPNQYGFMPQRSCEDAINKVLDLTHDKLKNKKCVLWLSVDFISAFDSAWWPSILNGLIKKLKLPRNIYSLIKDFLNKRTAIIKQGSNIYAHRKLERSCPQGSIISPFLWNILIDNIMCQKDCDIIAYADDCLLVIDARDLTELIFKTKKVIQNFNDKCSDLKLTVNPTKTFYMVLKKHKIPKDFIINSIIIF